MALMGGELRERITLERDSITSVNGVEQRGTPEQYAVLIPASVEFVSGSEYWRAQQVQSVVNVRIRLKWRTDVRGGDHVLWNSPFGLYRLEIKGNPIPDLVTRDSITLMCEGRLSQ